MVVSLASVLYDGLPVMRRRMYVVILAAVQIIAAIPANCQPIRRRRSGEPSRLRARAKFTGL
jgi:hypothetical protein